MLPSDEPGPAAESPPTISSPPPGPEGLASSFPAASSEHAPRILVVGCGGIGGILAAHLFEQGHDVTALTTNLLIADAINVHGFRLLGEGGPATVRGRAVVELPGNTRPFDFILLATQPPQVEEAARGLLPFLAAGGVMVCLQNGLCEERIARIAGPDRTLGAIVAWGAAMAEPGVYDQTAAGGFVLGRLDGNPDVRLNELARIFEAIGPTSLTTNLSGARWSKLAINCAISGLGAIGGDRLGVLMRHRYIRRLALEIMTEAVAVARASGVRLEKVSGTLDLDWIALTESERASSGSTSLIAKHALLLAVGARYRRMRSSMLSAIERGRPPAIDFLNGEVVERGFQLGVPTPLNAAVREQLHKIARGKPRPSMDLCRALFDRTRAIVNVPSSIAQSSAPPPGGTILEEPASAVLVPFQGGLPRAIPISPTLSDPESAPAQGAPPVQAGADPSAPAGGNPAVPRSS
jgi:2-dehydropantoate 2-reductase